MNTLRTVAFTVFVPALLAAAGCSTPRFAYDVLQQTQLQECQRIADLEERRRCEKKVSQSYDDYERQRRAASPGDAPK